MWETANSATAVATEAIVSPDCERVQFLATNALQYRSLRWLPNTYFPVAQVVTLCAGARTSFAIDASLSATKRKSEGADSDRCAARYGLGSLYWSSGSNRLPLRVTSCIVR